MDLMIVKTWQWDQKSGVILLAYQFWLKHFERWRFRRTEAHASVCRREGGEGGGDEEREEIHLFGNFLLSKGKFKTRLIAETSNEPTYLSFCSGVMSTCFINQCKVRVDLHYDIGRTLCINTSKHQEINDANALLSDKLIYSFTVLCT